MEFHTLAFSFIFALKLPLATYGNKLLPHMPNVCAEQELATVGRWQPRIQAFSRLVKVWKPGCGSKPWCVGYERRTLYYVENRQVYSMQYQTVYRCCSGWSQLGGDSGCNYPVCSFGVCFNGGNCVEGAPHICHCPAGFQGPCCQYDVNECETRNGDCESQCCNTIGSFYCKCPAGSRLKDDGKTCEVYFLKNELSCTLHLGFPYVCGSASCSSHFTTVRRMRSCYTSEDASHSCWRNIRNQIDKTTAIQPGRSSTTNMIYERNLVPLVGRMEIDDPKE